SPSSSLPPSIVSAPSVGTPSVYGTHNRRLHAPQTRLIHRWCSLHHPFGVTSVTAPSSSCSLSSRHPSVPFVSASVARNPRLPSSLSSSRNPSSSLSLLPSRVLISKCCQKKSDKPIQGKSLSLDHLIWFREMCTIMRVWLRP
ncbi:hypothetical protein PIB30_090843, partial [Stylosanthes scabra]|nr:hypothetical protein [Stylosanthes scabra]